MIGKGRLIRTGLGAEPGVGVAGKVLVGTGVMASIVAMIAPSLASLVIGKLQAAAAATRARKAASRLRRIVRGAIGKESCYRDSLGVPRVPGSRTQQNCGEISERMWGTPRRAENVPERASAAPQSLVPMALS